MIKMANLEIKSLDKNQLNEFATFCVPKGKEAEPFFIEGVKLKNEWLIYQYNRFGSIAKLAYVNTELVGIIQYLTRVDEQVIEIQCIYVPSRENQQKGIGKALIDSLIKDMRIPKSYFNNQKPNALITYAFEVPGMYPQHKFYKKIGFIQTQKEDPYSLYFPLKKEYKYKPKISKANFKALPDDKNKALIYLDPNCPFSYMFARNFENSIKEVKKDIEVKYINIFTQKDDVQKRGGFVPFCVVNQKPINTFFTNRELFLKEVKEALNLS